LICFCFLIFDSKSYRCMIMLCVNMSIYVCIYMYIHTIPHHTIPHHTTLHHTTHPTPHHTTHYIPFHHLTSLVAVFSGNATAQVERNNPWRFYPIQNSDLGRIQDYFSRFWRLLISLSVYIVRHIVK
jgi:hypothetical protein